MEKIKNILNPGHKKDDEILYGDGSSTSPTATSAGEAGGNSATAAPTSRAETSSTTSQAEPEHGTGGLKGKLLGIGGSKHTDTRQDNPAAETATREQSGVQQEQLVTDPSTEKKDHGILRQILNPRGDKRDEVRFGNTASAEQPSDRQSRPIAGGTSSTDTKNTTTVDAHPEVDTTVQPITDTQGEKFVTDPSTEKKEHGILRQILNPRGDKRDDVRYGNTASAEQSQAHQTQPTTAESSSGGHPRAVHPSAASSTTQQPLDPQREQLGTDPGTEKKDHGILKKLFKPHGDKQDDVPHDTTVSTEPVQTQDQHHYGRDAAAVAGVGAAGYEAKKHHDEKPHGHQAGATAPGTATSTTGTTTGAQPAGATNTPAQPQHHYGRNAAIAGGAGATAVGAYETGKHQPESTTQQPGNISGQRTPADDTATVASIKSGVVGAPTARSKLTGPTAMSTRADAAEGDLPPVPATGGKFMGPGYDNKDTSAAERSLPLSSRSGAQPATTSASSQPTGTTAVTRDPTLVSKNTSGDNRGKEALAGAAGAATAAGAGAFFSHDHDGKGHDYRGDPCSSGSEQQATGPSPVKGPHQTVAANLLDPSLARDTSEGSTGPSTSTRAADSATGPSAGSGYASSRQSAPTGNQHHYDSDAGLAGGAAAAAIGATKAWEHHEQSKEAKPTTSATAGKLPPSATGEKSIATSTNQTPPSAGDNTFQPADRHAGQDVAIAGGAGTAGAAAAAAYKHNEKKKPMPVIGERGLAYEEANPYSSKSLDPRVDAHPHMPGEVPGGKSHDDQGKSTQQHDYGRDAAIAGGAGAASFGAYEADKRRKEHDAARDESAGSTRPAVPGAASSILPSSTQQTEPTARLQRDAQPLESQTNQHHHGRDAAITGGAGAAGVDAYEADKHLNEKQAGKSEYTPQPATSAERTETMSPATKTIGPHDKNWKNILDPRVRPDPALMKSEPERESTAEQAATTGTGPAQKTMGPHDKDWKNVLDPRVQPDPAVMKGGAEGSRRQHEGEAIAAGGLPTGTSAHEADKHLTDRDPTKSEHAIEDTIQPQRQDQYHYGRDAALAGGAGATGLGAYELGKHHEERPDPTAPLKRSAHPATTSLDDQRAASTEHNTLPVRGTSEDAAAQPKEHHYGRDAAIAGGVGAAGASAYEAAKHHSQHAGPSERLTDSGEPAGVAGYGQQRAAAHDPLTGPSDDHHTETATKPKDHHYSRDAAVAGGAGAAGVGSYELEQRLKSEQMAKERARDAEKLERERAKEAEKHQKEHQKLLQKEKKQEEKERKHEEKEHHKLIEKERKEEEKEHQKLLQKERKEDEKERKQEEKEEKKEKKGGLLGFLHRDKDKKEDEAAAAAEDQHHHGHRDEAALTGTGAAAAEHGRDPATPEKHEKHHHHPMPQISNESGRNRLHKDPPPNHPAAHASAEGTPEATRTGTGDGVGGLGGGENTTGLQQGPEGSQAYDTAGGPAGVPAGSGTLERD